MQLRAAHGVKAGDARDKWQGTLYHAYIPYTYTHMLQYKIDSDVRLDGQRGFAPPPRRYLSAENMPSAWPGGNTYQLSHAIGLG